MARCLNCNNDIEKGRLRNYCPHCNYPQPTWSNKTLIVCYSAFAFVFFLAGFFLSWVCFVIFVIWGYFHLTVLQERKRHKIYSEKNKDIIEQEEAISSGNVNLGSIKLAKSSQQIILKANQEKTLEAEAKIDKKHIMKYITLKKAFMVSFILIFVHDVSLTKDGSPNSIITVVGHLGILILWICILILLYRFITRKSRQSILKNINNIAYENDSTYSPSNPQSIITLSKTDLNSNNGKNDLSQQQDFSHEGSRLTTIWNNDISHVISFYYPNPSGHDVTREIILTAIQINEKNEVHFVGFCFDHNDHQTFIANKISSNIEYIGQQYRISKFLTEGLGLDLEYVMGLVF